MKKTFFNSFFLTLVVALFSASSLWAQEVTFDFAANEWKHPIGSALDADKGNISTPIIKDDVITVFKYGTASTPGRFFSGHVRVYTNNVLKVFAPEGKAITKIVFTATGDNYYGLSADGLKGTTWSGNATGVKFLGTRTNRLSKMVVTLADKTPETVNLPGENDETVFINFSDLTLYPQFNVDNGYNPFEDDLAMVDGQRDDDDKFDTDTRFYINVPATSGDGAASSKNGIRNSAGTNYLYFRNGTIVFKCDADKIIKHFKAAGTMFNATINGETVTKDQLTGEGISTNTHELVIAPSGICSLKTLTFTLADKYAAEEASLAPTAFEPADNSTVGSYFYERFVAKFDEVLTLDNSKVANVKLYENDVEIPAEYGWKAGLENGGKDLAIFTFNSDNEVEMVTTKEGATYKLVIPAGIVKNASDVANAELTLTLNGPAPTIKMVSSDPANNSTKSSSFAASFNITFDKEITIDNSKASSVKLYIDEVGSTEIAPESGAWSLAKENDGKTLRVYSLDEYGEGPQFITPEAGKKYILVVPAATVKNGDAENKEIKITINGPAAPIIATSFDPADNSSVGSYFNAAFTAKFDEALTLDASKATEIKLYKGSIAAANEIAPEAGAWTAQLQNSNKELYIFSFDEYGEGVQTITTEEGQKYILVIPAGIVKNASNVANDELILTLNGPAAKMTLAEKKVADGCLTETNLTLSYELTFEQDITAVDESKLAAVKVTVDAVSGEQIPVTGEWKYRISNDKKTLSLWAVDDQNENVETALAPNKKYILSVPEALVKSNAMINAATTVVVEGPKSLVPTAYDPAEGSILASYFSATFTAKFDEALTLDNSKIASIKLYERSGDAITELTPDDSWCAELQEVKKSLHVWAQDYDGWTQGFSAKEGAQYQLVIPAGIVKNADGLANEDLILTLNGPVPAVTLVSTNPTNNATLEAGYLTKSFELTFDKAVSTTDALLNAGVTFTKNGVAVETDSWSFNLSNNSKTVQVYGKDMDGFTDSYQVAAGDVFVLTIAKDVFATETGAKSKEIKLTLNGPELVPDVLVLESSTPADGTQLAAGYHNMSFELTFAQAATTTSEKLNAGVTLIKNGTKVDVESWGCNVNGKTVQLFGMDADSFTDTYKVEEGDVFVLTIAKGVFTAPGAENDAITITMHGPAAPVVFNPTNIYPGNGDELNKFYGNYAMPHLELTFDENVAQILTTKPAIELRKGSVDGEVLPISGWKAEMVDETPNMITLDAWDYSIGSNIWFEAEDIDYYWIIPAGIVKNAAGGQNEQIVLMQKGIVKNLTVASTTPADKGTIAPGYTYYQFYVTFEEDIQIVNATPNDEVKFYENGVEKEPFGFDDIYAGGVNVWHALKDGAKTLYLWGDDGYELVDGFTAIDGATYKLVIAPGIVQDAAGNKNGEITIEFTCSSGSGINALKSADDKAADRFDLNGVRINASKKGVQIIRTKDGKTLKVTVK